MTQIPMSPAAQDELNHADQLLNQALYGQQGDATATAVVGWNFSTRCNNLWLLDWSDIDIGVASNRQVTRKSPNPNTDLALWQCVIDPNVRTYDLRSKMWTVMLDRPNRHLIYHNFLAGCPEVSILGCTVPQS